MMPAVLRFVPLGNVSCNLSCNGIVRQDAPKNCTMQQCNFCNFTAVKKLIVTIIINYYYNYVIWCILNQTHLRIKTCCVTISCFPSSLSNTLSSVCWIKMPSSRSSRYLHTGTKIMSGVKHVTHTVKITHYNKITIIELKMILTLAGQSQRLSHICTSKISGVFNGIQTHDLCNVGALPFNSSLNISFAHNTNYYSKWSNVDNFHVI